MLVGAVPETDVKLFCEWMWKQKEETCFDPQVLAAPRACMVKATREGQTIVFTPIQPVIFIESVCKDENATKRQLTLALYEIQKTIKNIMRDSGHTEAYFTTGNGQFADLCENHGWTKHLFDKEKRTWLMKLQCLT